MLIHEAKAVILRNDPDEIVDWFRQRTTAERSNLAKPLRKFEEDLTWNVVEGKHKRRVAEELKEIGFELKDVSRRFFADGHPSLEVALLATQPASELKQRNLGFAERDLKRQDQWNAAMMSALKDRELESIVDVFDSLLANLQRDSGGDLQPEFLLLAIDSEVIPQPDSQDYLQCLTVSLHEGFRSPSERKRQRDLLIGNQAFLDRDAYRLLQFESDIFVDPDKAGWKKLYVDLMKVGKLDRSKVLQSAVRGLFADYKQNVLRALVRFIEDLKPSADEMTTLAKDLSGAQASTQSAIGKFAFGQLKTLYEAKKIDAGEFLNLLTPVFGCPVKGTPKSAITLIAKIARSDESLVPASVEAMMPALEHDNAEVQAAALKWLAKVKDRLHHDHRSAIAAISGDLAATNRKLALELAGEAGGQVAERCEPTDASPKAPRPSAAPAPANAAPANPDPIIPISDHSELIDAIARAIEDTEDGNEAERIFDAISRLGVIPAELDARAAPVRMAVLDKDSNPYTRSHSGNQSLCESPEASPMVRRVLACALGGASELLNELVTRLHAYDEIRGEIQPRKDKGQPLFDYAEDSECRHVASYEPDLDYNPEIAPQGRLDYPWNARLIWQRMEAIERRLRRGGSLPLLAAPTHIGGWVDPVALVERLKVWNESGEPLDEVDFLLALLRLSPDNREAAIANLTKLPAVQTDVMQLALDADPSSVKPSPDIEPAWLNVAAHVRTQPIAANEIERLGLDAGFVCGGLPLLQGWRTNEDKPAKEKTREDYRMPWVICDFDTDHWIGQHPVLAEVYCFNYAVASSTRWKSHVDAWNDPRAMDVYWAVTMRSFAGRLEKGSTNYAAVAPSFDALFDPRTTWSQTACGAATLALVSKDNDSSVKVIDALAEAVGDARVQAPIFADAMVRVFVASFVRIKTFAENFSTFAKISPTSQTFAADALGRLIHAWCQPIEFAGPAQCPRLGKATDCGPVLELYLECLTELGIAPSPDQTEAFGRAATKGKVATLLKRIVALA